MYFTGMHDMIYYRTGDVKSMATNFFRSCIKFHRDYKRIEAASRYKFSQARGSN